MLPTEPLYLPRLEQALLPVQLLVMLPTVPPLSASLKQALLPIQDPPEMTGLELEPSAATLLHALKPSQLGLVLFFSMHAVASLQVSSFGAPSLTQHPVPQAAAQVVQVPPALQLPDWSQVPAHVLASKPFTHST